MPRDSEGLRAVRIEDAFGDPALVRALLLERHGRGRRLPDDVDGRVLVFAHRDEAAAAAYAEADREVYGHVARHELRESVGWVNVVDLRPRIAELERAIHSG